MKIQNFSIDKIQPKHQAEYQKTIDSIITRTRDFVSTEYSDGLIERLSRTLRLISLSYNDWFEADDALEQVGIIGEIIEFIEKTRFEFRNVEFYERESKKD